MLVLWWLFTIRMTAGYQVNKNESSTVKKKKKKKYRPVLMVLEMFTLAPSNGFIILGYYTRFSCSIIK